MGDDLQYHVDPTSLQVDSVHGLINAKLAMDCQESGFLGAELELTLAFYQDGIMRALIDTEEHSRFRISGEDLPVSWDQLIPLSGFASKFEQSAD